jgi:hypothetical protein
MANNSFLRSSGCALAFGGALTFLINTALSPFLPKGVSFSMVVASPAFLWRESASALAALLLLFGSVGLYLRQTKDASRFGAAAGAVAVAMALVGSALLMASEWNQIFDTRDLALRAPVTLNTLNSARGFSLSDLGAIIAIGMFTAGWIALAGWTLRLGISPRPAAGLVIAGFFSIPLLHAALPGLWGVILSNGVLAAGWLWLGNDLFWSASETAP